MTNAAEKGTATAMAWHATPLSDVLRVLAAPEGGLGTAEAQQRLQRFGPNRLREQPPPWLLYILLRQFASPLIYILLAAAAVSLATGHWEDAVFIGAVLLLNAGIGGWQEWQAELGARALQQLLRVKATVIRDGEAAEIDAEQVVPGDVVLVESGNRIPADLRMLATTGLEVDESLLTGESLPTSKDPAWQGQEGTGIGDRHNMAFAGSVVARGRGRGLVVATGAATVVGQLARDVSEATGGTAPLLERMEAFTRFVALAVLAAAALAVLVGVTWRGYTLEEMFLFSVALAVSAIPEGLPVALTVALSVAAARMARRKVIVRRLAAVEGLGSCTLIASDKTGTLTCNELTVREAVLPSGEAVHLTGEGFTPAGEALAQGLPVQASALPALEALARAAVLCNEGDLSEQNGAWAWRGDAVDVALLAAAGKAGTWRGEALRLMPQRAAIPFEPENRYAATFHQDGEAARVFVKGAPERVLSMCAADPRQVDSWRGQAEGMAKRGYRVLALAEGTALLPSGEALPDEPGGLRFLGFVGMIDPPRAGVREAIRACRDAGVGVCMITGDHPVTALAIAADLGLADGTEAVLSGEQLASIPAEQRPALMNRVRVFARVSPRQKLELVEAARAAGHYVAVTGDGVNDAPAMRAANIGVAMGKAGTDVAREAADLVLSDDNFATIVAGIEEGRIAYSNVRKVIYLLISTGAAEVLLVLLALAFHLPLPLLAVQFLWLNLVTNGIQDVALALEPGEGDELQHPPRSPEEPVFNQLMIERTVVAAVVIGGVCFAAFAWMLNNGWAEGSARNALLLLLVLFQNVHVGNCRCETRSALELSPLRSPILLGGTIIAQLLHIVMLYLPLGHWLLKTEPVTLPMWVVMLGLALTVFVGLEIHKLLWRIRFPKKVVAL